MHFLTLTFHVSCMHMNINIFIYCEHLQNLTNGVISYELKKKKKSVKMFELGHTLWTEKTTIQDLNKYLRNKTPTSYNG